MTVSARRAASWSRNPGWVALLFAAAVSHGSSLATEPQTESSVDSLRPPVPALMKVPVRLLLPDGSLAPRDSLVELKGQGDSAHCKAINRQGHPGEDGVTEFQDVPQCKIIVVVSVTGFDTKKVSVDLTREKAVPIRIDLP